MADKGKTEAQQAEEILNQNEEQFHLLVDRVKDYAIFMLNPAGLVVSWNEGARRIKGWTAEEITGQHFSRFHTAESVAAGHPQQELDRAAAQGRYEEEGWRVRRDGSRFLADVTITALRDEQGHLRGFAKITRDITERKQAEEQIQRLASFPQENPQPILEIDIDGRITFYNLAALEALGEMRKAADLSKFLPDDLQEIFTTAKETGEKDFHREVEVNGAVFLESLYFVGQFNVLRIYAIDITARKRQEIERQSMLENQQALSEELATTNEELQAQAEDLAAQKEGQEKLNADLVTANEEMESFSYSVSHDLKTPVRAIQGFSRMLLVEHPDKLDDEARRLLQVIIANATLMQHLIDDLLALSRLGRLQLKKSVINLTAMARQVFEQLRAEAPQRDLRLVLGDLPPALGDQSLLNQVMQNLLGNAIKYTGTKKEAVIEVGGKEEKRETVYYVKDNGVGFDNRYITNLFRPFQRLHPCAEYEGTGIGLAIVKRIIQRHGGRAWAEGIVGEGATFYFSLPKE